MVERQPVELDVAGSIPVGHPQNNNHNRQNKKINLPFLQFQIIYHRSNFSIAYPISKLSLQKT